jgi:hypothetical protein
VFARRQKIPQEFCAVMSWSHADEEFTLSLLAKGSVLICTRKMKNDLHGFNFEIEINCKNIISELANLATKIITLLEFFNFVSEVSRLQYE